MVNHPNRSKKPLKCYQMRIHTALGGSMDFFVMGKNVDEAGTELMRQFLVFDRSCRRDSVHKAWGLRVHQMGLSGDITMVREIGADEVVSTDNFSAIQAFHAANGLRRRANAS